MLLSDEEIYECVEEWIFNYDRSLLSLLEIGIPDKYRNPPKNKIIYRGMKIRKESLELLKTKNDELEISLSKYTSFTSSITIAKDFANTWHEKMSNNSIGIVIKKTVQPDDILISLGAFLRKLKTDSIAPEKMSCENEFLIKTLDRRFNKIKKDEIIYINRRN